MKQTYFDNLPGFLYHTQTDFMPFADSIKGQNLFGILVSSLQLNTFINYCL